MPRGEWIRRGGERAPWSVDDAVRAWRDSGVDHAGADDAANGAVLGGRAGSEHNAATSAPVVSAAVSQEIVQMTPLQAIVRAEQCLAELAIDIRVITPIFLSC